MLNILPKKYSLVALTDTLKGSPCQILSPCCCLDSSPPCRRCGVASLPCLGWWCRCRWLPGQRVIGYQAPGGKWHRCAGRNSHWCWQDDQRVWSGWGGSPASVAPSTHTVLCVEEAECSSQPGKTPQQHGAISVIQLINTISRHDLIRPIRWSSSFNMEHLSSWMTALYFENCKTILDMIKENKIWFNCIETGRQSVQMCLQLQTYLHGHF